MGSFPTPMIPAGENSDTVFRIPFRLLLVFSVYCSEMTTFFGLSNVGTQPGTTIRHLSNLVMLPRCDVGRGDSNVDHPTRYLNGVREGDPPAPSKRQLVEPSGDGI